MGGFFKNIGQTYNRLPKGRLPRPNEIYITTIGGFTDKYNKDYIFYTLPQNEHLDIGCEDCVFYELCANYELYRKKNSTPYIPKCSTPYCNYIFVDPIKHRNLIKKKE